jgi:hypothetical protein
MPRHHQEGTQLSFHWPNAIGGLRRTLPVSTCDRRADRDFLRVAWDSGVNRVTGHQGQACAGERRIAVGMAHPERGGKDGERWQEATHRGTPFGGDWVAGSTV